MCPFVNPTFIRQDHSSLIFDALHRITFKLRECSLHPFIPRPFRQVPEMIAVGDLGDLDTHGVRRLCELKDFIDVGNAVTEPMSRRTEGGLLAFARYHLLAFFGEIISPNGPVARLVRKLSKERRR